MKKYFLLFCISAITLNASSQNLVKDFFKSQNKNGEERDTIRNTPENDSIPFVDPTGKVTIAKKNTINYVDSANLKEIHNCIFLLRQDYSLFNKKKKKYYGYDGLEYFGTSYSLGLKCKDFCIITDEAVRPWLYDEKYEHFSSKNLEPIITRSHIQQLSDSVNYDFSTLDTIIGASQTYKDNLFSISTPLTSTQDALSINTTDTCKTGILVWVVRKSGKMEDGTLKVDFKYAEQRAEMIGTITVIPPKNCSEVLGCFYFTKTGNIERPYELAGMVNRQNQQYRLYFPFKGFDAGNKAKTETKPLGKLTEIKRP